MKRNLAAIEGIHGEFDRVWSAHATPVAEKYGPPTCSKGCHACCYEPAYVEIQEVELMLAKLTPAQLAEVTQSTAAWYNKAAASGILDLAEPPVVLYRSLRLPCPLLKDGLCMVYDNRPLACRSHFAVGPRERCDVDAKRLTQQFINPSSLVAQALAGIMTISGRTEMNHLGACLAKLLFGKPGGKAGITVRLEAKKKSKPAGNIVDVNSEPVD